MSELIIKIEENTLEKWVEKELGLDNCIDLRIKLINYIILSIFFTR